MTYKTDLSIINDEVKIIDCLVDRGEMLKNFDKSQFRTFFVGEDLHFVIYYADANLTQRFKMFVVDDFCVNDEAMSALLWAIDEQIKHENHTEIMKEAFNKILDIFYMRETFQALMGKTPQLEEV